MKSLSKTKGFTLIELVMVIVILGILAAVAVPKFIDMQSSTLSTAKSAQAGNVNAAFAIAIAENKANPTVTELATYVLGSSAVATGINVVIDGTTYVVRTYTDDSCSTATTAVGDTVACVGTIA